LKIIRPVMKKVIKKVSNKFGKEEIVLSINERREIQREKTEAVRAIRKLRGR
jgi:imidazole glycerol phosphate synthase subunit HisF